MNQQRLQQLYQDILCEQNIAKFADYFTDDCTIVINDKSFTAEGFKQRMQWIKDSLLSVEVEVIRYVASADGKHFSDAHITTAIGKDGKRRRVLVMQHSTVVDGKIQNFLDASYLLEGEQKDYSIINAS